MSYVNVRDVLPMHLIELIQDYVDGEYIYIPKREENKKLWGDNTDTKKVLSVRNERIYNKYIIGNTTKELAKEFYLSEKSIQRIILNKKKEKH